MKQRLDCVGKIEVASWYMGGRKLFILQRGGRMPAYGTKVWRLLPPLGVTLALLTKDSPGKRRSSTASGLNVSFGLQVKRLVRSWRLNCEWQQKGFRDYGGRGNVAVRNTSAKSSRAYSWPKSFPST